MTANIFATIFRIASPPYLWKVWLLGISLGMEGRKEMPNSIIPYDSKQIKHLQAQIAVFIFCLL